MRSKDEQQWFAQTSANFWAMCRDGEIEPASFRESVNWKHYCGVKRLRITTNKKREAGK